MDEGDTELGVDGMDPAFSGGGVTGHVCLEDGCVNTCCKVADRFNCDCRGVKVARSQLGYSKAEELLMLNVDIFYVPEYAALNVVVVATSFSLIMRIGFLFRRRSPSALLPFESILS